MAAVVTAGVAYRLYTSSSSSPSTSASPTTTTNAARDGRIAEAPSGYDAERERQNALMDEYGARDSLEELEKAVQFYQKRN